MSLISLDDPTYQEILNMCSEKADQIERQLTFLSNRINTEDVVREAIKLGRQLEKLGSHLIDIQRMAPEDPRLDQLIDRVIGM